MTEQNRPLAVGAAGNLKLHVLNYFRIDRATDKALEYSHRITNITWRATRGKLGAQLHAAAPDVEAFATRQAKDANSGVHVAVLAGCNSERGRRAAFRLPLPESQLNRSGIFASQRKARNALVRLATKHCLCHCLLGISGFAKARLSGDALSIDRAAPAWTR